MLQPSLDISRPFEEMLFKAHEWDVPPHVHVGSWTGEIIVYKSTTGSRCLKTLDMSGSVEDELSSRRRKNLPRASRDTRPRGPSAVGATCQVRFVRTYGRRVFTSVRAQVPGKKISVGTGSLAPGACVKVVAAVFIEAVVSYSLQMFR